MHLKVVVVLLAVGTLTGLFVAIASIAMDPPQFHPFYYIPGEQIRFTVSILNTDPRTYDFLVAWDDGATRTNWSGDAFDDVTIAAPQLSIVETFSLPPGIPDGDYYFLEVHDQNWIENNGSGLTYDRQQFSIRTWTLNLEMDRRAYLPGDTVTIIWSVNLIRDGSLAPAGYGQLWVNDFPNGNALINPNPHLFPESAGKFSFQLLGSIPTNRFVNAVAWFNSTASNADRFAYNTAFSPVDGLRMIVNALSGTYEPGAVVTVDVSAKVTDFPPNPANPGAANVEVDITVTDQTTGRAVPQYGALNLLTDQHGNLKHVFQLNTTIADGTPFLVQAAGVANNAVTAMGSDTFLVNSRAGMILVLSFDKSQYLSGDTATMTAAVSGTTGTITYIYEARDGGTGNLLDRTTSASNRYQYLIPTTFDGSLTFSATADDGQGNRRTDARNFNVLLGILTVNLDRSEYSGGDTITAVYALTRNPAVMPTPTYYYEIIDTSRIPNVLVRSGVATAATVSYQVPGVPATQYTFRITASEAGRSIQGSAIATVVSGVLLSISFDKPSYNPGDTMRIAYELRPRGLTALPANFLFLIAMPGAPYKTVQTTASAGELTYTVPAGMNDGDLYVQVLEAYTGASTIEVVHIGGLNPFAADVGGVPAISVVLLLLVVFLFILMLVLWRRTMGGMAPMAPGERPAAPRPPPPSTATPGPAPMSVTCKSCGSAIEITTSKRPIEVMCPSCGETQMVQ